MRYTRDEVIEWFQRTFGIDRIVGNEIQTKCPVCDYTQFYFHVGKQVGLCHKAKCNFRPTIHTLISRAGFGPTNSGILFGQEPQPTPDLQPCVLPGTQIAYAIGSDFYTDYQEAYDYLIERGIGVKEIIRWGLHCDGIRIYIPIRDKSGTLVNYNSRVIGNPEGDIRKYLYAKGRKTSEYIFGWAESRNWPRVALVENTFVSIANRSLHCTTVFGSNLSNKQAEMIANSKIESVAFLWDEGAYKKCFEGIKKLKLAGVRAACYHPMKGQPDDYPTEVIVQMIDGVHNAALKGELTWSLT